MTPDTPPEIKAYLAAIGSKGGKKSKRTLTPEQARKMVEAREKKKKAKEKGHPSRQTGRGRKTKGTKS